MKWAYLAARSAGRGRREGPRGGKRGYFTTRDRPPEATVMMAHDVESGNAPSLASLPGPLLALEPQEATSDPRG